MLVYNLSSRFPLSSQFYSETSPRYEDLVIIPDIEGKWKDFGYALEINAQLLKDIETKYSQPVKQKREMLRLAINNGVTWKQVVVALCKIDLKDVAIRVCSIFSLHALSSVIEVSFKVIKNEGIATCIILS